MTLVSGTWPDAISIHRTFKRGPIAVRCNCEAASRPRFALLAECPDGERVAYHGRPEESAPAPGVGFLFDFRVPRDPHRLHRRTPTLPDHGRIWSVLHRFLSLADEQQN